MHFAKLKSNTLNPTLWRTCRVLANKTRLRILRELCQRPEQRVSDIARQLGISLSLASQCLRALNARGLIFARRSGPWVYYSPRANKSIPNSVCLLQAIQKTFTTDKNPIENIFQYSTAFTHPRRIIIVKTLWKSPMQLHEISLTSNIPSRATSRHLRKLVGRGFLKCADHKYALCPIPRHEFACFLLHIARRS